MSAAAAIVRTRSGPERDAIREMVAEFFDFMRVRYPDMLAEIDDYILQQDIAGQLADFDRYFLPPHGECFLGLHEGAPAGMVMIRPAGDGACEMNRMYVRPAARGTGLGRALCAAVIAEARALGYRTVLLDALYRHEEALPLYRAMGFRDYSDPALFKADDRRVVHMRLDFDGGPA
ncbi:GNAT family N-acetyltransferase [Salipiger sp.]|uniref:GNAT family N-acetyltransferase n=1 Tax=Salipiger sp. TaxID=2078585 RepID=UPI003A98321E